MKDTTKRVALVTGASSGIGEATADRLARAGFAVYGTSRRAASAPGSFSMLCLDVTSEESVAAAVQQIMDAEGRLDVVVNNAGFGLAPAGAEESSIEQARALFDTNFFGVVRVTRAVIPIMRRQGGGRIINMGSVLGFLPAPYMALYASTKHAIEGYSESLDHELRAFGIHVSVVEPAYTKTSFDVNMVGPDAAIADYGPVRSVVARRIKELVAVSDAPSVVAEVVVKAATAPRPALRYTAGSLAARLRFLRRFAPAAMLDSGVRKDLRIDSSPTKALEPALSK